MFLPMVQSSPSFSLTGESWGQQVLPTTRESQSAGESCKYVVRTTVWVQGGRGPGTVPGIPLQRALQAGSQRSKAANHRAGGSSALSEVLLPLL